MKTQKIITIVVSTVVLASSFISGASAQYGNRGMKNEGNELQHTYKSHKKKLHGDYLKERKGKMMKHKGAMKGMHKKMMKEMEESMKQLPQKVQDDLIALRTEHRKGMKKIKGEYKAMNVKMKDMSLEDRKKEWAQRTEKRKTHMLNMEAQMEVYIGKMKTIVGDSPEGKNFITLFEKKHAQMLMLKKEHRGNMKHSKSFFKGQKSKFRHAYKGKKFEMRMKYRRAFAKRLELRLSKVSTSKLEYIITKISLRETKINNKLNISDERKNKILAQLGAIKDLIQAQLDKNSAIN